VDTQQIVVGVDDTASAAAALRWAADFARLTGGSLRVVHTWELPPGQAMAAATGLYARTATSDARARATRLVSDTLGADAERTRWVLEVRQGRPGHVLADLSREAALLVVGTGDHVGLRRVLLGSVSHHCLSHAACPVVAVPAAGRAADLDRPADTRVGAGTDIPG